MQLQKHVDIQGRNISFDRLYTSISLAKWLLSNNITCVGTLQANRKGISMELKSTSGRQPLSYECFWENENKKLVLHSYVVKTKSTGLRNVLLLSSMQPLLGTTKDDGKKNLPFTNYTTSLKVVRMLWTNEWPLLVAKQSQIDGQ